MPNKLEGLSTDEARITILLEVAGLAQGREHDPIPVEVLATTLGASYDAIWRHARALADIKCVDVSTAGISLLRQGIDALEDLKLEQARAEARRIGRIDSLILHEINARNNAGKRWIGIAEISIHGVDPSLLQERIRLLLQDGHLEGARYDLVRLAPLGRDRIREESKENKVSHVNNIVNVHGANRGPIQMGGDGLVQTNNAIANLHEMAELFLKLRECLPDLGLDSEDTAEVEGEIEDGQRALKRPKPNMGAIQAHLNAIAAKAWSKIEEKAADATAELAKGAALLWVSQHFPAILALMDQASTALPK